MEHVKVQTSECKVIEDYEELKEWWEMKSKPIVMKHFSTVHTSFVVDLHLQTT